MEFLAAGRAQPFCILPIACDAGASRRGQLAWRGIERAPALLPALAARPADRERREEDVERWDGLS